MCGIYGYVGNNEKFRMALPVLGTLMAERGKDSWGVMGQFSKDNAVVIFRSKGNIDITYKHVNFPLWAVYHTRGASVGEVTVANQHPFVFDLKGEYVKPSTPKSEDQGFQTVEDGKYKLIGVHNGHVSNHRELSTKWNKTFDVDSTYIYHAISNLGVDSEDLRDVYGWGNLVWWGKGLEGDSNKLWFSRFNTTDLHVVKIKEKDGGGFLFASTKTALYIAMNYACIGGEFYEIDDNILYSLDVNGGQDLIQHEVEVKFGARVQVPSRQVVLTDISDDEWGEVWQGYGYTGRSGYSQQKSHMPPTSPDNIREHHRTIKACIECCKQNSVDEGFVVCQGCFDKFYELFDALWIKALDKDDVEETITQEIEVKAEEPTMEKDIATVVAESDGTRKEVGAGGFLFRWLN